LLKLPELELRSGQRETRCKTWNLETRCKTEKKGREAVCSREVIRGQQTAFPAAAHADWPVSG